MSIIPGWGVAPAVQQGGLELAGSITFNGSDEYLILSSFSSSSPDKTAFTISLWVRQDNDADTNIYMHWFAPGGFSNGEAGIQGNAFDGGTIVFFSSDSEELTNQEVNDSDIDQTVWHHYVFRIDTSQANGSDRIRIYIDGSLEGEQVFDGPTAQDGDVDVFFDNGGSVGIGNSPDGGLSAGMDGRIADIIVVEGQSLGPENFGYDNSGTWSWMDYASDYGAHGFRINPQDNSEIGTDQSGNGYDFTLNNMDASNFASGDLPPT